MSKETENIINFVVKSVFVVGALVLILCILPLTVFLIPLIFGAFAITKS